MPTRQIVAVGNSVALTSKIPSRLRAKPTTVTWNKGINGTILMYTDSLIIPKSGYEDRFGFKYPMPASDVSMYIKNTNLTDTDSYTCTVAISIPNDGIKLISGETKLFVLVPPSTPKCTITAGNQYVGSNVTLRCHSAEGKPTPKYTWKWTTSRPEPALPRGYSVKKGNLTLTNLSETMSGLYSCTSENEIGNASCSIKLVVITPNNAGIIVGAVVGVLLGICLIIALVICFCKHQRREAEKEEDTANEIKVDAQAPTRNTWAMSGSSDIISKNGTLSSVNSTMHVYKPYPTKAPSDTASTITAMGVNGTGSYKRPKNSQRSADNVSIRSSPGKSAPPYASFINTHYSSPSTAWQNGVQTQAPRQVPAVSSMSSSNLTRMGAVPVMVPAQNQAGSLV
ncbi:endothelial cell-selective adhesion molecule-like isoform X2 [Stegostoma tigrinum]|nr:endothelial cell-selective adhesion molecule-like isoform X2 [Stegostoma tigrinum]